MKKSTTREFIRKAKRIHKDRYDYSKVKYTKARTKVEIICPIHGEFWQSPDNHLRGNKCPSCSGNFRSSTEEFIKKAKLIHGDKYDYSESNYVNNSTKIKIICPIHGEFWQPSTKHINLKSGCPDCGILKRAKSKTNNTEYFIRKSKKIHGDEYDYSESNYVNNSTKIKIICRTHGEFWQSPSKHTSGQGCPVCKSSRGEKKVRMLLKSKNIAFKTQYKFNDCKNIFPLPFDLYIPDRNICIEYDGKQHYDKKSRYYSESLINNDRIKDEYCRDNNIKLIRIPYWDFNNIESILNEEMK